MVSLARASRAEGADVPLRLAEVPALIAELTGKPVNFKSVYRWVTFGRRGIVLELLPDPLRKRTTRAMVERFLARLAAKANQPPPPAVDRAVRKEQTRKQRALAAAGR